MVNRFEFTSLIPYLESELRLQKNWKSSTQLYVYNTCFENKTFVFSHLNVK